MDKFLRNTLIKKTRKTHKCFACGELINKGLSAMEWVSIADDIFSAYTHKECWDIVDGICFNCGNCGENDGYTEGFLKECINMGFECYGVAAYNGIKMT